MTDDQVIFSSDRSPKIQSAWTFLRENPQLWLAGGLIVGAGMALYKCVPALAGALGGASATMLGTWLTAINTRRSAAEGTARRQDEARKFFAPELHRIVQRTVYIHKRTLVHYGEATILFFDPNASRPNPGDNPEDFVPHFPVLFPNTVQLSHLSGNHAYALALFYDSLTALENFRADWWDRENQQKINILNTMLHQLNECLRLSLECVDLFKLEEMFPKKYAAHPGISKDIQQTLVQEEQARARFFQKSEERNAARLQK
jgi:hypothetical protein